jgi:hypothetical protein
VIFLSLAAPAFAQNLPPGSSQATATTVAPSSANTQNAMHDVGTELQKAVASAANDRAALVRNLQDFAAFPTRL